MPRKQRFKPSRKPKPSENPTTEPTSNQPSPGTGKRDENPGTERHRIDPGDIETGGGMRTNAVIDDSP
jgi:hypothetical protein